MRMRIATQHSIGRKRWISADPVARGSNSTGSLEVLLENAIIDCHCDGCVTALVANSIAVARVSFPNFKDNFRAFEVVGEAVSFN